MSTPVLPHVPGQELFELGMLGGNIERRYRKLRPEVETLPWGTLRPEEFPEHLVLAARKAWTEAAFQEHRTAAACTATLQALIAARAPLDLIGMACRFPLDEMVHVELCARLASELGGGIPLLHDPLAMFPPPRPGRALMQAAELVVRNFCVGEAISIPLLRGTWRSATHPLVKAVLGRIVKDEAAHGQFGRMFLDWALPSLEADEQEVLRTAAGETIAAIRENWSRVSAQGEGEASAIHALGWMKSKEYLELARGSMETEVLAPLRARGLEPR
ncbi:ferritin-like domain-containing protein [Archangium sp.]|uniref:ferritin-like domain-containing protein n=1 Tax=Archangium sp. TaxID=1872627 RepID=UPI00286CDBB3|nr:ferritin-like domain-containing protein [Archangium sp.]